jgi:hypothetical protein
LHHTSPSAPKQDDSHNLDNCKQKSKKSRSNHPSESLCKKVAGSYVPDRLGKNATELMAMKNSKQPALVPQHPLHSKKRSILKELKDVDALAVKSCDGYDVDRRVVVIPSRAITEKFVLLLGSFGVSDPYNCYTTRVLLSIFQSVAACAGYDVPNLGYLGCLNGANITAT